MVDWVSPDKVDTDALSGAADVVELPAEAVSRAWLKMEERCGGRNCRFRGARVPEIGSAPGGASQALLAGGCYVLGIDPAEMAPVYWNIRDSLIFAAAAPRSREFGKIRWLTADMNVCARLHAGRHRGNCHTPASQYSGVIVDAKLSAPDAANQVPQYLDRVRGWGYNVALARQLQYNRREVCIAALQMPFRRKSPVPQRH